MTSSFQALLVASGLIVLHAPDGHEVFVNPGEVTTLHQKLGTKQGHFVDNASCMVNMTDGRFVTVIENCLKVIDTIKGTQQ